MRFFSTAQPFPPCSTSQPLKPSVGYNRVKHEGFALQLAPATTYCALSTGPSLAASVDTHPPTASLGWLGAGAPTQLLLSLPGSVPCPASLKSLEPLDFNSGPDPGCYLWGPPALTPRIYSVPLPTASQNGLMFLCKLRPLSAPSLFLPSPPLALPSLTTAHGVEGTSPVVQWQTPLPTTQEKTLHMDITRWSMPKSD